MTPIPSAKTKHPLAADTVLIDRSYFTWGGYSTFISTHLATFSHSADLSPAGCVGFPKRITLRTDSPSRIQRQEDKCAGNPLIIIKVPLVLSNLLRKARFLRGIARRHVHGRLSDLLLNMALGDDPVHYLRNKNSRPIGTGSYH